MKCNKYCCDDNDKSRSDRPATAATTEAEEKVDVLNRDDRRIASELCATVEIGKLAVMAIIKGIGYRQECTKLVTKMLAVEHKAARYIICIECHEHSENDDFCQESVDDHYDPLMKGQSWKFIIIISRRHARKIQVTDICAKSWLASSGRVAESCMRIAGERYHTSHL